MQNHNNSNQTATFRWWFTPSWLGLDAPCVVSTWTWAISQASGADLSARTIVALFLVVWSIYLADRLVDVASCRDWQRATGRLLFGRDYQVLFRCCFGICLVTMLGVLWVGLPAKVVQRGVVVALGVGLHFLAFVKPLFLRAKLPGKEFGVGLFFALGAYACLGVAQRTGPLLFALALLVAFNCLLIAARDADSDLANDPGGASRWWRTLHRDLGGLGLTLVVIATVLAVIARETSFYISLALAFGFLTALHRTANRWSGDAVRALADFALFTPLPVIGAVELFNALSNLD